MSSNVQTLRFRRPDSENKEQKPKPAPRHTGILQDQLRRAQRRPWTPSFSVAVRIMLLIRALGAMYSNIDDCDEVYNFWEPLHFLDRGYGFQTWEVAPQYAIRSWAYILLHLFPTKLVSFMLGPNKRPAFFAVRYLLAIASTITECAFYRTVVSKINERVGRYLFFMMLFNAGMWNASTAFLPSSFAMYTTAFAFSYALEPASLSNNRRTLAATLSFALGAIIGWPFALAISLPFVVEELLVFGSDRVAPQVKSSWLTQRWTRFLKAVATASLIFVPVITIDSLAYGRLTIVPWNIVKYNIFGGSERGPDLYGTSPWYYYISNLLLNFNYLFPLALVSLPALAVTYVFDRKRLGFTTSTLDQSSPISLLALRLAPFYLWLAILTAQAHKEERFMFPAYPLLCFNAAVTLYLMRGWMEVAFIIVTKSPYQASWHRFAGHYLVPTGIRVEFIKSDFRGQLPRHFKETADAKELDGSWWPRPETRYIPADVNDLNEEDETRYVPAETCDYVIDLDHPLHPAESPLEPRYAAEFETWERAICKPFLDARHSSLLTRALWLPGEAWQAQNEFGDYCLLRNKALVKSKQKKVKQLVREGVIEL
ncbi:Alpha-1,2-mannosyltransferase alg9 [Leucoagaricus sp. SymC.cos]|nr:Alpha-1,2-mannosyltransferase alg9 [Leucoagaricus sp. SymC.cos]